METRFHMVKKKAYDGVDPPIVDVLVIKFAGGFNTLKYAETRKVKGKYVKLNKVQIVKEKRLLKGLDKIKKGAAFKKTQMLRCLKKTVEESKDSWSPKLGEAHEKDWIQTMQKRIQLMCRDFSQAGLRPAKWFLKAFGDSEDEEDVSPC